MEYFIYLPDAPSRTVSDRSDTALGYLPGMADDAGMIDGIEGTTTDTGENPFDMLTEDELMQLEASALEAVASGALILDTGESPPEDNPGHEEGAETIADEAAESPEEQAAEAEAGTEEHIQLADIGPAAEACALEADEAATAAEQAAENADLSEDGDPKKAKKAADEAREAADEAIEAAQEAVEAVAEEDYETAAGAYMRVEEAKLRALEASQDAIDAAGSPPPVEELEEDEEGEGAPAAASASKPPQKAGNPGYGGWATRATMR